MTASSSDGEDREVSLLQRAISKALAPLYIAISRPALKAYLSTILFLGASITLLVISTVAYLLFYYNYIPQVGLNRVIHLQYADGPFPHSTTYLTPSSSSSSSLTSLQPYDITVHLHLPRTPTNLAAGNFMLDLFLLPPPLPSEQTSPISSAPAAISNAKVLAHSRRPAILPYQSPIMSLANTFLSLPLHALSFRDIDSTTLSIPMFEKLTFARGRRNLPASAKLEIQTQPSIEAAMIGHSADLQRHISLQVYSARIEFHARFRGLRWLMYSWRTASFLAFTSGFYCLALLSAAIVWSAFSLLSPFSVAHRSEGEEDPKIKEEAATANVDVKASNHRPTQPINNRPADEEGGDESGEDSGLSVSNLSESATTFPTLGRQMPIQFPLQTPSHHRHLSGPGSASGSARIKKEDPDDFEGGGIGVISAFEAASGMMGAQDFAEDEGGDEELDSGRDRGRGRGRGRGLSLDLDLDLDRDRDPDPGQDSGIGTSMEESAREAADRQSRRTSKRGSSEAEHIRY